MAEVGATGGDGSQANVNINNYSTNTTTTPPPLQDDQQHHDPPPGQHSAPHGKKRPAPSSLESDQQRLNKRFHLLNLAEASSRPPSFDRTVSCDHMQLEETPHRVYIHDLAAELSDVESDEEKPIFIHDIEKHLAKIPKHVLQGPELKPTKDNQLVLYNVPSSLTIPEEQDRVRRAIVEARARLREGQANPVHEPETAQPPSGPHNSRTDHDPDAMDID